MKTADIKMIVSESQLAEVLQGLIRGAVEDAVSQAISNSPKQDQNMSKTLDSLPDDTALSSKEAAAYLGLQSQTLNKWRCDGFGPEFHKIGRNVRYLIGDLRAFRQRNTIGGK